MSDSLERLANAVEKLASLYSKSLAGLPEWASYEDMRVQLGMLPKLAINRLITEGSVSGGSSGWIQGRHYIKARSKDVENYLYSLKNILEDASTDFRDYD